MSIVTTKRAAARIRWQRDRAIQQLIKARRHHRASNHILYDVLSCVTALRGVES
jgi:hypothetical protein